MSQQQEFIRPIENIELADINRLIARGRRLQSQAVGESLNRLAKSLIPLRARRHVQRDVPMPNPRHAS